MYSTCIRVQYIIDYVPDHLDTKAFAGTWSRKSLLFLHNEKQFFQLTVYKSYPWTGPTCGSSSMGEFSQTRYILQGYPHMYTWTPLGDFPLNESKGYSILISCLQFFLLQSPVSSKSCAGPWHSSVWTDVCRSNITWIMFSPLGFIKTQLISSNRNQHPHL